jgi:hypothetical protein
MGTSHHGLHLAGGQPPTTFFCSAGGRFCGPSLHLPRHTTHGAGTCHRSRRRPRRQKLRDRENGLAAALRIRCAPAQGGCSVVTSRSRALAVATALLRGAVGFEAARRFYWRDERPDERNCVLLVVSLSGSQQPQHPRTELGSVRAAVAGHGASRRRLFGDLPQPMEDCPEAAYKDPYHIRRDLPAHERSIKSG